MKRVEIDGEIALQKPVIKESEFLFIFQIRTDNFIKEFSVFTIDEKVKFMTGVSAVFFDLLILFQFGPVHKETEFPNG